MNLSNIKYCKKCGGIFTATWDNQISCDKCEPVRCDPVKIELYRAIGRKMWSQASAHL